MEHKIWWTKQLTTGGEINVRHCNCPTAGCIYPRDLIDEDADEHTYYDWLMRKSKVMRELERYSGASA